MKKIIDTHWFQIKSNSYSTIENLVQSGAFTLTEQDACGPGGIRSYQISTTDLEVISDEEIRINRQPVYADVYRMPSHAYRALIQQSPDFEQYPPLKALQYVITRPDSDGALQCQAIENAAHAGRYPSQVLPVDAPAGFTATWLPQETWIRQTTQGHWMMALRFTSAYTPGEKATEPVSVGLDLGLDPVTTAYTSTGRYRVFEPTSLKHLAGHDQRLSPTASRLLRQLTYQIGRADTERVINFLTRHATEVYAEKLTHRNMSGYYVQRGRDHAIHDHHFSALSQYLYAAGLPFDRVSSHLTSQICGRCLYDKGIEVIGKRSGDDFTCACCGGKRNAHINAAHVVLLRGQGYGRGWGRTG